MLENEELKGFLKSATALHSLGKVHSYKNFVLVCVGSKENPQIRFSVYKAMDEVYNRYSGSDNILALDGKYSGDALYALVMKSYSYQFLKKKTELIKKLKLYCPENNEICLKILKIANAQNFARFLGDTPANLMTPVTMSEYIKDYFLNEPIDLKIFDKSFLEKEKMNLVLAVSQGSAEEPRFIHAKYFGRDSTQIDLAMVGKGVTFDTGGISIKPSREMFKLKQDMMGAAILTCVLKLVSQLRLKVNVSLTLPLVENMPGASAVKPGDVVKSLSGKTVEIDNTDAEGRLILADAITFAQRDNPKYLIDVATLTGAVRIALGNVHGAYFTDDEAFSDLIYQSGKEANDIIWRLPLSPFFEENLKSPVADICNIDRSLSGAGASVAANFIKSFVNKSVIWAHFDVSGIRNNHFLKTIFGDQTTARPLASLFTLVENLHIHD
ncbi:uncharacterized protein VICG_00923 [Vittaforma corneae ATCC 50505]|uniref:Cytosol aminopeptidase domain-containing protein n=1 Tax=Vittaforma corneae (strain ATCC 50505) TaxID=993615 RepID=L2GN85_VITCO|nr:uncharacterized protein VICG_00923 [Vittaforma corneae ATCC 50505]ELA42074.1 hypothetical protein VICG_00923 [Vittaforma corneae ATCC 50505]